ncbi:YhjD/YihY/BrkB family envelope integrity protein [Nocardiopsis sp. CNT-189]|uniref:YhjD/YihY/BrkB family envelope integrity protein n=1 Tax=Nocardiopsis oceanisediminis TaxID=2816862 RepID=UPI003B39FFAA
MDRWRAAAEGWIRRNPVPGRPVLLVARTVRSVARTRIVGLAAESAFFSLLSLPALLLGLVGTLGHFSGVFGEQTVQRIRARILELSADALTQHTVDTLVAPLVDDFLRGAQGGVLSLTFLVSLWSGSRALNVFIEAITIAYGLDGLRGYIRQRLLALLSYLGALVFALAVLPVMVVGPDMVHRLLPATVGRLGAAYWPAVAGMTVLAVATLYLVAVPERVAFWRHLPGAVLAAAILLLGSVVLRLYFGASFGQVTIYGSLAAPIAVVAWLWVMALAVLIGSALNAEIDLMWPTQRTAEARAELAARRFDRATRQVERHEQALQVAQERSGEDGGPEPGGPTGVGRLLRRFGENGGGGRDPDAEDGSGRAPGAAAAPQPDGALPAEPSSGEEEGAPEESAPEGARSAGEAGAPADRPESRPAGEDGPPAGGGDPPGPHPGEPGEGRAEEPGPAGDRGGPEADARGRDRSAPGGTGPPQN